MQHLERVAQVGGRLLVPGDLEWPRQLDDLGDSAPWALWVRGTLDLRLTALRSVAVVGARAATAYGERVASQLGSDLAGSGWSVVSGGAFGIDGAAHLGRARGAGPHGRGARVRGRPRLPAAATTPCSPGSGPTVCS